MTRVRRGRISDKRIFCGRVLHIQQDTRREQSAKHPRGSVPLRPAYAGIARSRVARCGFRNRKVKYRSLHHSGLGLCKSTPDSRVSFASRCNRTSSDLTAGSFEFPTRARVTGIQTLVAENPHAPSIRTISFAHFGED